MAESMNDRMYGDWSGVQDWWNQTTSGIGNFINDVIRASGASYGNPRAGQPTWSTGVPAWQPSTPRTQAGAVTTPQSFGGPDAVARRMQAASAQQPSSAMGMSDEELLAWILGGSGGGGGVNLSGYNQLLSDIASREAGLGTRKAEQSQFLTDLFDAAEMRMREDKDALAQAVSDALISDQARREAEIGLIRGEDASRLATANAAREALGVAGGEDLSSQVAQNAAAGVSAAGSVAERDARILESIERQQLADQIAGLLPMEQLSVSELNRGYEDRLSALASERAAVRAQMAQAAASGGSRGPSVSEKLSALSFINQLNAPAATPEFSGILGTAQGIRQYFGPASNDVLGIANRILTGADLSRFDPTSLAGASELLSRLATDDPQVQNFLNRNPEAAGAIINYVVGASK